MIVERQTTSTVKGGNIESQLIVNELHQSIFESYSPINDALRLRNLQALTQSEKEFYIKENVLSYLEEFAGEISLKKLSGILKPDGALEMLGANVTEMYRFTAQNSARDSRENNEMLGMDAILHGLNNGANRAMWISPPKLANYGFGFLFQAGDYDLKLGGRPIHESLIRYDEDFKTLNNSRRIHSQISNWIGETGQKSIRFKTDVDFLKNPILFSESGIDSINNIGGIFGLDGEGMRYSEYFRNEITNKITPWLDRYNAVVQAMANSGLESIDKRIIEMNKEGELLIGAMFNISKAVKRRLDEGAQTCEDDNDLLSRISGGVSYDQMMYTARLAYHYEPLVLSRGSSCPVAQQIGSGEQTTLSSMRSGLGLINSTVNGFESKTTCGERGCSISKTPFHCPGKAEDGRMCKCAIMGTNTCPSCGLTKEKWAEMTGIDCA